MYGFYYYIYSRIILDVLKTKPLENYRDFKTYYQCGMTGEFGQRLLRV